MKSKEKINLKQGQVLKLGISKFSRDGKPIMMYKGMIIFLDDFEKEAITLNRMFEVRITKVLPKHAFAERIR